MFMFPFSFAIKLSFNLSKLYFFLLTLFYKLSFKSINSFTYVICVRVHVKHEARPGRLFIVSTYINMYMAAYC